MTVNLKLILGAIIVSVLFLVFILIITAILRRLSHSRKYKELDRQRKIYRARLLNALRSGQTLKAIAFFSSPPRSIKWQAIEDVLLDLINEAGYREDIKNMLDRLGYISYYERQLNGSSIIKASAIDKLGKMLSESSIGKLAVMLKDKDPEVIAVTIRALSRIGSIKCLITILERLPYLLKKELVSRKTIKTSLIMFGIDTVPVFLEYGEKYKNPTIISIILEVLAHFHTKEALPFAMNNFKNINAEVRAKALKVIGMTAPDLEDFDGGRLLPMLDDPVWFVRLQAAKALGNIRYTKASVMVGGLLLDEKWQVRDVAAMALTKFGNASIDIFLRLLRYKDIYAKESICEGMEKTDFVYRLIENLDSDDREIYEKSKEILHIMGSLNFITPLLEYMKKGENGKIRKEIELIWEKVERG